MSVSSKSNLPKIIQPQTRNKGNLNTSTGSGDGDDEYEDDFEKEQQKMQAAKENIEIQNQNKPKSRSYSGRKELELRNQNKAPKIIIQNTTRDADQQSSHEAQLPQLSHRSKQSNVMDEIQQQQTPTRLLVQIKQQTDISTSKIQASRILSSSASQQTLLPSNDLPQQIGTTQMIAIVRPKKHNISIKSGSTIANESTQQTIPQQTIEEKELEDDSEPTHIQPNAKNKVAISVSRNEGGGSLDNKTVIKRHKEKQPQISIIDDKTLGESKYLSKGTSQSNASNLINNKITEERKPNHKVNDAQSRVEEIQRVQHQLSQSPSNYSLAQIDASPMQQPNGQSKSLVNKRSVIQSIGGSKQSPNFKRIVNIYSVNNYKKKKYLLGGQQQSTNGGANNLTQINNSSSLGNVNISQIHQNQPTVIYRGDDIKIKLKQLREGLANVSNINNIESDVEQNHSAESRGGGHLNNSNLNANGSIHSIQLPELKSITPQIQNVKQHYAMVNNGSYSYNNGNISTIAKLMSRKKSYERLIRLDQQLYHLYKQGGNSQKIDSMSGGYLRNGQNSYIIKSRGYQNGSVGNHSVLGGSGIANDLDIQGKSMISSKQIVNHSYL